MSQIAQRCAHVKGCVCVGKGKGQAKVWGRGRGLGAGKGKVCVVKSMQRTSNKGGKEGTAKVCVWCGGGCGGGGGRCGKGSGGKGTGGVVGVWWWCVWWGKGVVGRKVGRGIGFR